MASALSPELPAEEMTEPVPEENITLPTKFMTLHIMFSEGINEKADKLHKEKYKNTIQNQTFKPKTQW
jgi:hypothetical protein